MKIEPPNFKAIALDFCKRTNTLDVQSHADICELGYSLAISDFTKKIVKVREGLNSSRERSNRPQ